MQGRRAVKGTVVEKRNGDREPGKDSDRILRTHAKLEGDGEGPLEADGDVTERWKSTGNLKNEFLFRDGNCFSAHQGTDKVYQHLFPKQQNI